VDKDPGALGVAKTNIWKEASNLARDYNYGPQDRRRQNPAQPRTEFSPADSLVDVELEKQTAWLAEYHQASLRSSPPFAPLYRKPDGPRAARRRLAFARQNPRQPGRAFPERKSAGRSRRFCAQLLAVLVHRGRQVTFRPDEGFRRIIGNPPWKDSSRSARNSRPTVIATNRSSAKWYGRPGVRQMFEQN